MANGKQRRTLLFILLSIAALSHAAFAAGNPFTCDQSQFSDTMKLCGIAALSMFALIAVVYMGGEAAQSPRMLTWAKSEAVQAFASIAIVAVLLFVVASLCNFQVGEMQAMFGLSSMPKIYQNAPSPYAGGKDTLYNGAMRYVENLAALSLSNVAALRYDLGAYEVRTSYNTFECQGICIFSLASTSVSYFGGESMNLAISNNLLGVATVSYLSSVFQYFTLVYIYAGLFAWFLPMAIVVRSIPFMRHFGGALIAIFVSLYILYPLMLVADAYVAPGLVPAGSTIYMCDRDGLNCAGKDIFAAGAQAGILCSHDQAPSSGQWCGRKEWDIEGVGRSASAMTSLEPPSPGLEIKVSVLIFLAAVFLPALNWIIIAAFGRELSRFLGEEADMSRLGQMI